MLQTFEEFMMQHGFSADCEQYIGKSAVEELKKEWEEFGAYYPIPACIYIDRTKEEWLPF